MARQDVFRRELQCNLTPAELAVFSDELARLTTEEIEIEAAKKEVVSEYGAKLQKCVAARRLLATKISTKKEYRQVDVEWQRHFEQNCATLIRLDTYEVVDTRPLTSDERQQELDLQTPDPEADDRQESIHEELEDLQEELPVAADVQEAAEPAFDCKGCKSRKVKRICGVENCTA